MLILVGNCCLSFLIEDVNLCGLDSNLDLVACFAGRGRCYAAVKSLTFAGGVDVFFCTHKLGNFNVCFNNAIGECCDEVFFIVNVLGADTEYNFLVNVRNETVVSVLLSGKLDSKLNAGAVSGIFRPNSRRKSSPFLMSLASMKFI